MKIETYLKKYNSKLNNRQFAERLGFAPSTISWKRCRLGLNKMEMEYWTPVMVQWLQKLYPFIGDLELAQIFEEAYPKNKPWTLKHIEKKRLYLGLKRTKEQLKAIKQRNKLFGSWKVGTMRSKITMGSAPTGTVKVWKGREYIKVKRGYAIYARWLWEQVKGKVPEGFNVVKINPLLPTEIENLHLLSNAQLGAQNSIHRYPLELRRTMNLLHQLKNTIHAKQSK